MKIVIYTVIIGRYDELRQPACIDNRFTYLCYSNDLSSEKIGVWEIRKLPLEIIDNQRLSRYPKIKPHELLNDFDYSVYMDANIVISKKGFYDHILDLIKNNEILAGVKNGYRDCLYEEGFRCILSRLDSPKTILREMRFIKSQGFPAHFGMYEANVIFRNHNDIKVINQCNLWWEMVQMFAKRDQLSYSYTTWKNSIPWCYIFPDGTNTHNNPNLTFHEHPYRQFVKKSKYRTYFKFLKPVFHLIYKITISL